eukprot:1394583-Pleurochrysis_carterae.AAC.6
MRARGWGPLNGCGVLECSGSCARACARECAYVCVRGCACVSVRTWVRERECVREDGYAWEDGWSVGACDEKRRGSLTSEQSAWLLPLQ